MPILRRLPLCFGIFWGRSFIRLFVGIWRFLEEIVLFYLVFGGVSKFFGGAQLCFSGIFGKFSDLLWEHFENFEEVCQMILGIWGFSVLLCFFQDGRWFLEEFFYFHCSFGGYLGGSYVFF